MEQNINGTNWTEMEQNGITSTIEQNGKTMKNGIEWEDVFGALDKISFSTVSSRVVLR